PPMFCSCNGSYQKRSPPATGFAVLERIGAMRNRLLLLLTLVVASIPALAQQSCETLTKLSLPGVTISSAISVPAGNFQAAAEIPPVDVPAFCRIQGVVWPEVKFELWMP